MVFKKKIEEEIIEEVEEVVPAEAEKIQIAKEDIEEVAEDREEAVIDKEDIVDSNTQLNSLLSNHEQRLQQLESAFFRLKSI